MREKLLKHLAPIRQRRRIQSAVRVGVWGVLCSAAIIGVLGIMRAAQLIDISAGVLVGVAAAGPVLGLLSGAMRRQSWQSAAEAVDRCYKLSDRTVSALEFSSGEAQPTKFRELQIRDAERHLIDVNSARVAVIRVPDTFPWATISVVLAIAILLTPTQTTPVRADSRHSAGISQAAVQIAQSLERLDQIAAQKDRPELTQLVQDLRTELATLNDSQPDVRKSLAAISEMQNQLASQRARFSVAKMDVQLQNLSQAMADAGAFDAVSGALKDGDYRAAANELKKLQEVNTDSAEARAASEKLAKVAEAMKHAGFDKLGTSVSSLADNVQNRKSTAAGQDCQEIARGVRQQQVAKDVSQMLQNEIAQLAESRTMIQNAGTCIECGGNCPPGQCQAKSGAAGSTAAVSGAQGNKSQSSGAQNNVAGGSAAPKTPGRQTQLQGELQMARLSGMLSSEGDTQKERVNSVDSHADARRLATDVFSTYQKTSEAVLDTEPIPPGRKRLIRRYFESIRPQNP
jgi:hypothetical protein